LKQGSLFHGFGGLARGLEDAGFETVWAYDLLTGHDIAALDPRDSERVDLISGGPPCQRGSVLSHYKSDRRNYQTPWKEMLRFVEVLRPRWIVVENVPGFQRQMVDWTADLHKLGYGCAGQSLDSRHWVPQQRTRCFIVGRLGVEGMALWNHLYASGERIEARESTLFSEKNCTSSQRRSASKVQLFSGSCPDCLRGGIFAGHTAKSLACLGAGNAVTQTLAAWLGEKILAYERTREQSA
jgi:site-specific DNA-cytosine methylase